MLKGYGLLPAQVDEQDLYDLCSVVTHKEKDQNEQNKQSFKVKDW